MHSAINKPGGFLRAIVVCFTAGATQKKRRKKPHLKLEKRVSSHHS